MPNEEIGKLNVVVNLDSTGFQNGISQLNRQMKLVQSEFQLATAKLGNFGSSTDKLKLQADALTKQIEIQRQKVAALEAAYQQSVQTKGADAKATQDLAIRLNKAQAQLATMENELKKTTAELERQTSMWYKLSQSAQEVGENLKKVGDKIADVGKSLSTKITAPIVGLGTLATKSAIDFESAFAGVRKTVDATEEQFTELEKGIRAMSKEMPQSASDIAAVAEAAGQLGIKTENILGFTKTMIMLGDTTNLTSDQAATALARLANITRMPQSEFDKLGSSIVALGNNLATTESEIIEMGLRLAGTASQVGMTEDQILALAGAMSSVGINAEAGGSSMSRVMQKINTQVLSSGSKLQQFAKIAGMTVDEFSKTWKDKPQEAILAFVQGLDKVNKSGGDVTTTLKNLGITSTQEIDTLLRLSGAHETLADALEISSTAWEENKALAKEAEQRYKTSESQLAILKNTLNDVAITIGQTIVPIVLDFAERIKALAERFASLSPETQRTILVIAGLAAAIGPVILVVGRLITAVGTISTAFGTLSGTMAAAGGASGAVGTAISALTGPVGIAIAAITGLIAIFVSLYKHNEDFRNKCNEVWNQVKQLISTVTEQIKTILQAFVQLVSAIWNKWGDDIMKIVNATFNVVKTVITTVLSVISGVIKTVTALIKGDWQGVWNGIKDITNSIWSGIKNIVTSVLNLLTTSISAALNVIKDIFSGIWNGIKTLTSSVWEGMKNTVSNAINSVKNTVLSVGNGIKNGLSGIWESVKSTAINAWNSLRNTAASVWNSIKTAITTPINNLRSALSGTWSSIVSSASSAWNSLRNTASNIFSRIRDTILAPFRNLRIPLPHLSVSVSYKSIAGIRIPVPDFDIRWYATGGIFNRPSVIGVGEKGPEAVIPIDRLKDLLGDAAQKQIIINVYTNSADRIVRELRYQLGGGL